MSEGDGGVGFADERYHPVMVYVNQSSGHPRTGDEDWPMKNLVRPASLV